MAIFCKAVFDVNIFFLIVKMFAYKISLFVFVLMLVYVVFFMFYCVC